MLTFRDLTNRQNNIITVVSITFIKRKRYWPLNEEIENISFVAQPETKKPPVRTTK